MVRMTQDAINEILRLHLGFDFRRDCV
jgi:hypothetical protein